MMVMLADISPSLTDVTKLDTGEINYLIVLWLSSDLVRGGTKEGAWGALTKPQNLLSPLQDCW